VWRTVSSLRNVAIEVRVWGPVSAPRLGVRSNVGQEVSQALRREIGAEVARAEQRIRAEVDRMVEAQVREVEGKVAEVRSLAEGELARRRAELESARRQLESEIREFARRVLPD
jgi:ABC-type phosphate transport system auxiliary subunit